ncbi:MAG TPA: iron-sulfur cluster assembly scaffold protein [Blastocatellia bacterium]|nr:iron-sulfur cluster assembly scaffold protein [Blastocatellia bacterium]
MYSKQVAEHIANPRNVGELESPSGVGDVINEVCMDRIRLTVRVDGGRLSEAKVRAQGCPPTIAAASVLTELITGRPVSELQTLGRADITDALGHLPPAKKHCAALALEALREALDDIARRASQDDPA